MKLEFPGTGSLGRWISKNNGRNLVLMKGIVDIVILVVWLPSFMIRTHEVYSHLCPPLWSEKRCNQYVYSHFFTGVMSFISALSIGILIYWMLWRGLKVTPAPALDALKVFTVVHLFLCFVFTIVTISFHTFFVPVFILVAVATNFFVLSSLGKVREEWESVRFYHNDVD